MHDSTYVQGHTHDGTHNLHRDTVQGQHSLSICATQCPKMAGSTFSSTLTKPLRDARSCIDPTRDEYNMVSLQTNMQGKNMAGTQQPQ